MHIVHYHGYDIAGEDELEHYATTSPGRLARTIEALEQFIAVGPTVGSCLFPLTLDEPDPALCIYLVPPRAILRGVPDMGAVVLVDQRARVIRLLEIIEDYGGDDHTQWRELTEHAERRASEYL